MTNSQPSESPRVLLPGVAVLLFVVGPLAMAIGGYLAFENASITADCAASLTLLGFVIFGVGVVALMSALILEGVRSVAQQQLHLLRKERE